MPIKLDQLSRADFPPTYKGVALEVPDELPRRISGLFWLFARPFKWPILLQLLMSTVLFVVISMQIYTAKNVADTAMKVDLSRPDAFWLVFEPFKVMLALFAVTVLAEWTSWFGTYRGRIRMLARARQIVFSYVQRHNVTYFDDMLTGKVAHRVMLMPEQITTLYERLCWDYLPFVVQSVVSLALFYQVRPVIAGFVALWLVVYVALSMRMGRRIARYGAKHSDVRAQMTGRIVDSITNIRNVVYFAAETTEDRIVTQSVRDTMKAQRRQYREYVRMRIVLQQIMQMLVYVGIFPLAITVVVNGQMTSGEFVMVSVLILNLLRSLMNIANGLPETYDIIGSINDSLDMLVVPRAMKDAPDAKLLTVSKAEVRLENVSFAYNQWKKVFEGLTLTIPAGQRVGLIGTSGAGKTTLSALLMRLYDVQGGQIIIDGQDIAKVTQESLRRAIGLIPQDSILFHRTLADNIRYGRPDASDDEVREAAKRAHAHEFITLLPKGYETLVGERGIKLSGGQRQRIAVARAILKNAPILILDEATSALDSESEAAVQEAMADVMAGKTVIAIAHRLSTIAHLDRLIVLEQGRIVEDGSHAELLAKGGLYAQLWARQSGGFLTED